MSTVDLIRPWLLRVAVLGAIAPTLAALPPTETAPQDRAGSAAANDESKGPPDADATLVAVITTTRGVIRAELAPSAVPRMVANFVTLARRGVYDDLPFHAVARGDQIHSGDPTGTGDGGPGYGLEPQFSGSLLFDEPGMLAMWAPRRPVGSQFFITLRANPRKYNLSQAAIGRVVAGMDVATRITTQDRVVTVTIEGDPSALLEAHADEVARWSRAIARLNAKQSRDSEGAGRRERDRGSRGEGRGGDAPPPDGE